MPSNDNNILDRVNSPADLKKLDTNELLELSSEIRHLLVDTISKTGGHLGPNLGVVELTIALHKVFDSPIDKIIWDVGHQTYVHKILTERKNIFSSIRQFNGCQAFASKYESQHDNFTTGHAGVSISSALGMAVARDLKGEDNHVITVVGDGSLNCGISLEGLNNISEVTNKMIIILNDNKMSISENVGALSKYLNKIISNQNYNSIKSKVKKLLNKSATGQKIRKFISRFEEATKGLILPGVLFEHLGLRYIGPIDGHDLNELINSLSAAKTFDKPVIIHTITEKGKGYEHAANSPIKFHGISKFDKITGEVKSTTDITFSKAFGKTLTKMATENDDVVAITAAMSSGTGLDCFKEVHQEKFFDVGIAEEHALVFAAGLANNGLRPYVAIYSTFLQRALDNIFHDICLQKLPVTICVDRAGVVEDGASHHGIFDLGFMIQMPQLNIWLPKDEVELREMLYLSHSINAPVVIRYPKGSSPNSRNFELDSDTKLEIGKSEIVKEGREIVIWATNMEVFTALEVAELIEKELDFKVTVVNSRFLKPFDTALLNETTSNAKLLATIEDHSIVGGLANIVNAEIQNMNLNLTAINFGWSDLEFPPQGKPALIKEKFNLDAKSIAKRIIQNLKSDNCI